MGIVTEKQVIEVCKVVLGEDVYDGMMQARTSHPTIFKLVAISMFLEDWKYSDLQKNIIREILTRLNKDGQLNYDKESQTD